MRANNRGFTLIEVMVSLLLSSIVIVGGYAVMATQQKVSRQQTQLQASQQGVAVAMELLQRDIRKAGLGFGFCRYQEIFGTNHVNSAVVEVWRRTDTTNPPAHLYAITVTDGGAGPDSIVLRWGNPPGDGSADARADATGPIWTQPALQLFAYSNPPPLYHDEPFLYPVGCDCGGTGTACGVPDGTAAKPNILALAYPLPTWPPPPAAATVACSVVEVTSVTNPCSTTLQPSLVLGQSAAAPWNRASGGAGGAAYAGLFARVQSLGPTSDLAPAITQVGWRVEQSSTTTCSVPPCLIRETYKADGNTVIPGSSQVVAVDIEDLQIVPACDVSNNGLIDAEGADATAKQSDEWFNNVAGDTVTADCLTYPLLRVSLVSRTSSTDPSFAGPGRPALENRAAGSPDGYRRRILSAVVRPPNVAMYLND